MFSCESSDRIFEDEPMVLHKDKSLKIFQRFRDEKLQFFGCKSLASTCEISQELEISFWIELPDMLVLMASVDSGSLIEDLERW